jgi:hypothetical protein
VRTLLCDRDDVTDRPMFGGLTMRGFVTVPPDALTGQALRLWVAGAVAHAETQPPKQPKRKAVSR